MHLKKLIRYPKQYPKIPFWFSNYFIGYPLGFRTSWISKKYYRKPKSVSEVTKTFKTLFTKKTENSKTLRKYTLDIEIYFSNLYFIGNFGCFQSKNLDAFYLEYLIIYNSSFILIYLWDLNCFILSK